MAYFYAAPETALGETDDATTKLNPVFRVDCAAGCTTHETRRILGFPLRVPTAHNTAECQALFYRAARLAITIANKAAALLEANPVDTQTVRIFTTVFGHPPSHPVTWDNNRPSGASVAYRLREVARQLHTRVVTLACGTAAACGTNVAFSPRDSATRIVVCQPFWDADEANRAGTIIHEMLHLLFREFFSHQGNLITGDREERRRDNANCYKMFALQATGHTPDAFVVNACHNRPA